MQYGVHPNLLGDQILTKSSFYELLKAHSLCFQHAKEFFCYLLTPKCAPKSNEIIPQCREMCYGYLDACNPQLRKWKHINCDYLPSLHEEIPCFYKPVRCKEPPKVNNATVVTYFDCSGKYVLHHKAEYSCHQGFKMEGNKTIVCEYNGHWPTPPQCSFGDSSLLTLTTAPMIEFIDDSRITSSSISAVHFLVVVLLLVLLFVVFVTVIVIYKIKFKKSRNFNLKADEPDTELTEMEIQRERILKD